MLDTATLLTDLSHCIGTETYYKHWLNQIHFTDGIKTLADGANCYWLIDAIASYQPQFHRAHQALGIDIDRQTWVLIREGNSATLSCDQPAVSQTIEFTDFPLPEIKLYLFDQILLLTSEY